MNNDPLLQFISKHATNEDERNDPYKITVMVAGVQFTGHVCSPGAFLEDALATEELTADYQRTQSLEKDAGAYLHLHATQGPDITDREQRKVRIRMDSIDAWWNA